MREFWVNVYPGIDVNGGHYLGLACKTPDRANDAATGFAQVEPGELRRLGVGYRLHVRVKVSALPATDGLSGPQAGDRIRQAAAGQA